MESTTILEGIFTVSSSEGHFGIVIASSPIQAIGCYGRDKLDIPASSTWQVSPYEVEEEDMLIPEMKAEIEKMIFAREKCRELGEECAVIADTIIDPEDDAEMLE